MSQPTTARLPMRAFNLKQLIIGLAMIAAAGLAFVLTPSPSMGEGWGEGEGRRSLPCLMSIAGLPQD